MRLIKFGDAFVNVEAVTAVHTEYSREHWCVVIDTTRDSYTAYQNLTKTEAEKFLKQVSDTIEDSSALTDKEKKLKTAFMALRRDFDKALHELDFEFGYCSVCKLRPSAKCGFIGDTDLHNVKFDCDEELLNWYMSHAED